MKDKKLREKLLALINQLLGRHPGLKPLVMRQAKKVTDDMYILGHPVRIVEGYRSLERQAELYAQGRTTPGPKVTNAKPGYSWHNYGLAVDFVFKKEGYNASDKLWKTLGAIIERHGFEWGGSPDWIKAGFNDRPHAQLTKGYTIEDAINNKIDYTKYV
jgi:peptidoglycan L-alanyl-D-glutamate endopeptidase CwlK